MEASLLVECWAMVTPLSIRDPAGIRPAFYYVSEEVVVVASERPVIQTVFNTSLMK